MNDKSNPIYKLIEEFSGQDRILVIPRIYIELTGGDHIAALLLNQCIYWSSRTKIKGSWFYKSSKDWNNELGLSHYQVGRAAKVLSRVLERKIKKASGAPTQHWHLDMEKLKIWILEFLENEKTPNGNSRNFKILDIEETSKSLTIDVQEIKTIAPKNGASENEPSEEKDQDDQKKNGTPIAVSTTDLLKGGLHHATHHLVDVFISVSKIQPIKSDIKLWAKTIMDWQQRKFTDELIQQAIREMNRDNLRISGPQSLTKIAISIKASQAREQESSPIFHREE